MQFRAEMSQWKKAFYDTFAYQIPVDIDIHFHESENIYLYPQELSKFALYGLNQNWVNFDHFENKCKNKALFKITQ